jgi:geranylgeranyl diphosphate synthase type II
LSFEERYRSLKTEVEEELERVVPPESQFPPAIHQAIRYSVFAGGKRLRPVLVLTSAETVGGEKRRALPFAAAVELIHTYTLIHDDLPALDNDDFRRGKPTNHRKFGEANAVLAGDALLTLAFEVMSDSSRGEGIPDGTRLRAIHEISRAIGTAGTIGGQVLDLELQGKEADLASLEYIHTHKTGYLILACVRVGGILGGADEDQLRRLSEYGKNVGLAFQIVDDILDVEGDRDQLGKEVGSDARQRKITYPSVLGMKESKALAQRLTDVALSAAEGFGPAGNPLKEIAEYVLARNL